MEFNDTLMRAKIKIKEENKCTVIFFSFLNTYYGYIDTLHIHCLMNTFFCEKLRIYRKTRHL